MLQLLRLSVNQHALNALLTPFYFLIQSKKLLLRFAMLVISVGMMSGVVGQATVISDKPDYAPRSNAVFTGAGFQAFEQVQLKVKNLNSPCNTVTADSSYLPWTVVADANGAFVTNWTVCDCPGDSLRLKATGITSGLIAYAYFTDGVIYPSGISVPANSDQNLCLNSTASPITATMTTCELGGGASSYINITYTWYYNTSNTNVISGSTVTVQTSSSLTSQTTTNSYTPLTTTTGTRYYFCRVTFTPRAGSGGQCGQNNAPGYPFTTNPVAINVNTIDYANLQFPSNANFCAGGDFTAYGQVYEPGITEGGGQGSGVEVQFGYNTSNTNPETWTNWSNATFNTQVGNNDEYTFTFSTSTPGTYYYTFRYKLSSCTSWQYGGYPNGFWNGTTQNSGVLTVNSNHTLLHNSGSLSQSICEGTAIAPIQYSFGGGATGVTVSGLPAGVSPSIVGNTVTLSGTPTVSFGTYNYTVTTTGNSCTTQSIGGTITVKSKLNVINLDPPLTPSICFGNSYTAYSEVYEPGVTEGSGPASPNIVAEFGYGTTNDVGSFTWATAAFNGPASLFSYDGYLYTFTPPAAGVYYYTFRYSFNGCDWQYTPQVGTLTVDVPHTLTLASGDNTQEVCEGTAITAIQYEFGGGATSVNVSGLPAGVSSSIAGNVLTISGTPTVQFGTFNYTVTTVGGSCPTQSLGGTIIVKSKLDYVNLQYPLTATVCLGQSLTAYGQVYEPGITPGSGSPSTNIIAEFGYGTTNNSASFTWVTASFNSSGSNGNNDEYQYSFTPTAAGNYYYTYRYSFNGCDWQYASEMGTLTVNEAPVITTVYSNISKNNDPGFCGAVVTYTAANASGSPAPNFTYSHPSGSLFPVGTTTVTVTATNSCGTDAKSFTVTVTDNEDPTITAPATVNVNADNGSCAATNVSLGTPATGDNCAVASVTNNAPASFPVGSTTVIWTVTDVHGRTATATQVVTVTDNQDPTITAPTAVSVNADNGSCTATNVALGSATTADNCGVASVINNAPASFPVGSTTVTWTVTDVHGRTATATQVVTVIDNQDPTITAPATVNVNADNGSCAATNVSLGTPATGDNCAVASVTNNASASFPVGSTTVTWTVTDVNGRTATATQVVTVTDNQNPVISNTPSNISVYTGAGSTTCNKIVTWTAPTPSDNCAISTFTSSHTSGTTFAVGTTTVTYTATDVNGNSVTSSFTVTVIDNTNPVVNVQNITLNLTAAGTGTITAAQINNGSTDNCGIASVVLNKTNFTCADLGSQTVTLTVTDIHGNSASANATVLVKDITPPTVLTKNITVNLDAAGNASITAAQVDNGSSDVCGPVTLSVSPDAFNCSNVSLPAPTELFITEYIEGSSNNKAIEIYNGTGSSINLGTGGYAIRVYFNGSTSFTSVSLTGTIAAGDVYVIANGSSNASILSQTDQTSSVMSFNGNDAVALVKGSTIIDVIGQIGTDPGTEWGTGSTSTADNTIRRKSSINKGDNNGSDAFNPATEWDGFVTDATGGLGTHTFTTGAVSVTLTVTDGSGNQSTGTAYVTVIDNIAPSLTPAANQNVNLGASCSIVVPDVRGTATDNCAGVTITQSPVAGSTISLTHDQTTNITVTATDASGNTTVKTVVLTAKDVTPPVLTPAANQNVNLNTSCSIVVPNVIGTATDNCTGVTIAQSPVAGTVIPLAHNQTYNITVTATDAAGLTDIKTVVLTAKDVTAPTVITKNITVQLDASGNASISPADVNNGSTDNCGTVNLVSVTPFTFNCNNTNQPSALELIISEYVEGGSPNNIKYLEIYNGTSSSVNLANYSLRVYSNGSNSVTASNTLSGTLAPGATIVYKNTSATGYSGAATSLGMMTFNGNDAVALFNNTTNQFVDIIGKIGNDPGAAWTGTGGYTTVDATLRRKSSVRNGITTNPLGIGANAFTTLTTEWDLFTTDDVSGLGNHFMNTGNKNTVTLTVNDGNGNQASGYAYVTVEDKIKPVITNNGDKTVNTDPGVCGATVTVSASATDNCSVGAVTGVRSDGLALTALYSVGTTTIKWNVTDINGNAAIEITQTIVVTDNEKPVITSNGNKTVNTDPGVCGATVTVSASASDNCSVGTPTGVRSDGLALTALYPVGTTTIKWNVTDVNGNAAIEVTQTVVVTDNEKPVITSNGNKIVNTDPGVCGATVAVSASATDNCTVGTPTGVRSDGKPLTDLFPVGTTTIKWNVTDVNGNAAIEVTQTVVVTDNEKPIITSNGDKTVNTDPGVCGATVAVSASATDNCTVGTPTGVRSDGLALTALYPVGTTTIKWNVTDVNGNAAIEVTQTIVVTDNEKPVITSNGNKTVNTDPGVCGATVAVSASATDNCTVGTPTGVRSDGLALTALYPVGTTTIKWNVTDVNGNAAIEVTQTVVVTDNEKPVITSNGDKTVNTDPGVCGATVAVSASATDNCTVGTPTGVRSDGLALTALYPVGTTTIKWNVTDVNGNAAIEVTQTVVVTDNEKPTAIAQNVTIYLNAAGTASTTAAAVNNSSSDNCGIATLSLSKTDFNCSNVGTNNVVLTVTDVNGNSSTANAVVTVVDNIAPTAICKNIAVYLDQSGTVSIANNALNNGSYDNCTIAGYSLSQTLFTAAGSYTVTMTVTDVNGNSSTCSATVTVDKRPVTLVYTGDYSEQYSDQQTLTAKLTDQMTGNSLSGKTISFTIGSQNVTAVTNASGIASVTLILTQNPDVSGYKVNTSFAGDATYSAGSDEDDFDIQDEDARAEYIGTQFQATSSATSGTATVQLQASILDITAVTGNSATDAYAGNITNARVKFVLYNGSTFTDISGWLTPALINSSDSKVGVVSYNWPVNINTADAAQYNVGIVIDEGYYIGEAPVNTITVVTVYKPLGDFVTGGGYIMPTQSGGTYASTPGLKMNFGLNVKYNKKGTNLQGGVNMIFRRNVGGVIRTYQIKSNSMTSLGTSGTSTPVVDRYAEFLSKANLTDVTNPLAPVALGGNLDLRVSMRDRGEPGNTDEIAVTLFNGGTLLFSSKWTGSNTQRMLLTGGNIVVRGDNYGTAPAIRMADPTPVITATDIFNVKVLGNPSLSSFRLQLQSSDKQQKITVKIVDVNGRIVEVKENLYAGQVIEVGSKYTQGTYFAEVMQGTNRKVVKLIKIARE
ncbi:HYR domain-containing protein [Lacibacter luteus]|uniref:HYR domain-containing protein n=1 Tax=Lacibacter luteus TaxID=2508719 RepID=A0A4Q1CEC5_9BACT|nr:HYR domain-containing protein [Lacibacter luteus]RXK57822.1 HYR domain-containing protein [Lacibacter luteus]